MRTSRVVMLPLLASVLATLAGCPLGKKKAIDNDDASAAPPPATATATTAAPATPAGANETSVARYADEKPVSKDTVINFSFAAVTEAAGAGKTVTLLKKGTAVTQLAEHAKFALVAFKDPKDASRTLLGWVSDDVFGEEPVKTKAPLTCKAGEKILRVPKASGTEEQCHRPCNPEKNDCSGGLECGGVGVDKIETSVLVFFCQKPPPPPPLVCSAGETKLRVRFPSGVEDNDCVRVCSPAGAALAPEESDRRCPAGFFCGGVGTDPASRNATSGFCTRGRRAGTTTTAVTAPAVTTPPPPPAAAKVKCVLPSPPPCASPHAESPKGLCQVPCPTGDCSACGGTCQKGFCVTPL